MDGRQNGDRWRLREKNFAVPSGIDHLSPLKAVLPILRTWIEGSKKRGMASTSVGNVDAVTTAALARLMSIEGWSWLIASILFETRALQGTPAFAPSSETLAPTAVDTPPLSPLRSAQPDLASLRHVQAAMWSTAAKPDPPN